MTDLIIFEDDSLIAVNKPAGVLSQGDKSGDEDLADFMKRSLGRKGFLAPVHRLDRNTSGIILLAKSSAAAKRLTELIQSGELKREYFAVVKGDPGERGSYHFPLRKDEAKNQVFVDPNGQAAETRFERLQKLGNSSVVRVNIVTGRSHQIRVHFAHAGHALLGDKKYAKKPWSEIFHRPALHAWRLTLPKEKGSVLLEASIPHDLRDLVRRLGGEL